LTIEQLISLLAAFIRNRRYSFYTSTLMRDNPNVCHGACMWFLDKVGELGIGQTLALLDSTAKSAFAALQRQAGEGVAMYNELVRTVQGGSHGEGRADTAALRIVRRAVERPLHSQYIGDVVTVVANIAVAMRTRPGSDAMMIYMLGESGGGHVICLRRNVGGLLIYDPNIGVASVRLADTDTWTEVLRLILRWYRDNGLTRFAYMFK
jgi:hypothetical protein